MMWKCWIKKTFQKLMVGLHFKGSVEFGQIENGWKVFQEKKVWEQLTCNMA